MLNEVPHFQKHGGMACYGIALQPYSCILPMAVRVSDIKVFIGQVKAAGIADAVIDHRNFAVVTVIHKDIKKRDKRVENTALNAQAVQPALEFRLYITNASEIVIDEAYFHALLHFLHQNFFNTMKSLRILYRKIFHEYKGLRAFQIRKKRFQSRSRLREIGYIRILIDRETAGSADVVFLIVYVYIFLF